MPADVRSTRSLGLCENVARANRRKWSMRCLVDERDGVLQGREDDGRQRLCSFFFVSQKSVSCVECNLTIFSSLDISWSNPPNSAPLAASTSPPVPRASTSPARSSTSSRLPRSTLIRALLTGRRPAASSLSWTTPSSTSVPTASSTRSATTPASTLPTTLPTLRVASSTCPSSSPNPGTTPRLARR